MPSSCPLPSPPNPAGRLTICWLPEIHAIAAVSSELTASVAINDGIRARVIISQENVPTAAPPSSVTATAAGTPRCSWASSQATRIAPRPTSVPTARSITPAAIGTTRPTATRQVTAWLDSSDRQVAQVRNVSGTHSANTANISASRYSADMFRNAAARAARRVQGSRPAASSTAPPAAATFCVSRRPVLLVSSWCRILAGLMPAAIAD